MPIKNFLHSLARHFPNQTYQIVDPKTVDLTKFESSWQDQSLPAKQWSVVRQQLAQIRQSQQFPPAMQAIVDLVKLSGLKRPTILEIGCSSGYIGEVLKLAKLDIEYQGCDYSASFIDLAKKKFPKHQFQVCDATQLPYRNGQFEMVVSGCCILHILDYPKAIAESARVAKQLVIFHKTPIVHLKPTLYTVKTAYGVKMFEIQFNETEFINLLAKYGLSILTNRIYASMTITGLDEPIFYKDYLCRKQ